MPRMSGLEATAAIRALGGAFATVPIVAMTANALRADRDACLAAGMNDFVVKPISVPQLSAAIGRVMAGCAALPQPPKAHASVAFDQKHFEALAAFIGTDDLAAIVDSLQQDADLLLRQMLTAGEPQHGDPQPRSLESLGEASAALGFSETAERCRSAIDEVPVAAPAIASIRRSLELNIARARAVLSTGASPHPPAIAGPAVAGRAVAGET